MGWVGLPEINYYGKGMDGVQGFWRVMIWVWVVSMV